MELSKKYIWKKDSLFLCWFRSRITYLFCFGFLVSWSLSWLLVDFMSLVYLIPRSFDTEQAGRVRSLGYIFIFTYRVFIKYCVFLKMFNDFSELCQLCCKRWGLTYHCVHTLTPRSNRERQETRIYIYIIYISKSSKKNTIFNEHPVYLVFIKCWASREEYFFSSTMNPSPPFTRNILTGKKKTVSKCHHQNKDNFFCTYFP